MNGIRPLTSAREDAPIQPFAGTKRGRTGLVTLFVCLISLMSGVPLHAQWNQVWGGNFPGTNGTTYDHTLWWNDVRPTNSWGDQTIQNTSDSTNNVYVDGNGNLVVAMTYTPGAASPYTSARLTSRAALGPYGRFDTKIQNSPVGGTGAAFWALGADAYPAATAPNTANPSSNGGIGWPSCGELDMMELQSKNPSHNGSTVHGSTAPVGGSGGGDIYVSSTIDLAGAANFDNSFHVFTTQWAPYHMQFFLDGATTPYGDINLADTGASDTWELNQPINPIISTGIGGNGGTPATTGFPSNTVVQYVDYSKWAAGAPAPVSGLTVTSPYSNAVNLSWNASPTAGVTYDIYASTAPNVPNTLATLVAQNVSTTSYKHTGLQPNTTYYYTVVAANFGGESSAANQTITTGAIGNSTGMQLSAGGYAVGTYMNSSFVVGGNTNAHLHVPVDASAVTNPAPSQVYDTERWGAAAWTITGLTPGAPYTVRMHFVETTHTGAGQRNFNVSLNSYTVLTNFDIFQNAGAINKAITQQFSTQANAQGLIELQTQYGNTTVTDLNPTVSAIEIIPGATGTIVGATPGNLTDLAINSGGGVVQNFVADEDFNGGEPGAAVPNTVISTTGIANAAPQGVYQTSRISPFTYVLTGLQANATYNLNLHFAETFFTANNQRVFNVAVNGKMFLPSLDIFAKVGANHALVESTSAVADQYGQVIVQLLAGSQNTPLINGIEATFTSSGGTTVAPPTNLTSTATSSSQINLAWTASTTSGVTYQIYASKTGSPALSAANLLTSTGGTAYSATGLTASTTYYYAVVALGTTTTSISAQTNATTSAAVATSAILINAGGGTVGSFVADTDFVGGGTYANSTPVAVAGVANAAAPAVYQDAREGEFTYTVLGFTPGSVHTVSLHFAELYWPAQGQREFNVAINGTPALTNFDIVLQAGGTHKAIVKQFQATADPKTGAIVIAFTRGLVDQAALSALVIQ